LCLDYFGCVQWNLSEEFGICSGQLLIFLWRGIFVGRGGSRIFGGGANSRQQSLAKHAGTGGSAPPRKILKIDAKILQFKDISTYYTTLKIRYSS